MRVLVLAGGDLLMTDRVRALTGAPLVIAADSGLRHARRLGLRPQLIVGDFDSVGVEDLQAHPEAERVRYPQRKDELDLELALDLAVARGAHEVTVLGAFGSRFDQSLAALLIACRLRREVGLQLQLHDGVREGRPLVAGEEFSAPLPADTPFSLLALEDAVVSVSGAEYELKRRELRFGVGLGLANRSAGAPRLTVHSGLVVLLIRWADEG